MIRLAAEYLEQAIALQTSSGACPISDEPNVNCSSISKGRICKIYVSNSFPIHTRTLVKIQS